MENKKCEHNKFKNKCKKCKGKDLCIHNKIKLYCYDCSQLNICKHYQNINSCKECNIDKECKVGTGPQICIHKRVKAICKECKGSQICIHDKRKAYCVDCKGSQICIHDKLKTNCKECKGSQVCIHLKIKISCRDCGGKRYCIHNLYKYLCRECDGKLLCLNENCKITGMSKYDGYCVRCYINLNPEKIRETNYLTKELNVTNFILSNFNQYKWSLNLRIKSIKRRPDLLLELNDRILIIEIEEHQHKYYDKNYENIRTSDFLNYFNNKPIIFIYFNPDEYIDLNGISIKSCWQFDDDNILYLKCNDTWNKRLNKLKEKITYWINNEIKNDYEICKLFFDEKDTKYNTILKYEI
jgi:hypothetical protein